jgi:raffinose/stachyose/melibiose transport system substrate-binding protein
MFKKRMIGALVLLVLFSMTLFAAGSKDTQVAASDEVTIKVFHYMTQLTKTQGLEEIQRKFKELNPNVSFENIFYNQGTDYFPQLQTALNSGDLPEIIMGNPALYPDLIENGYAMVLDDNQVIKDLNLTKADLGDCSYNGNVYAFPVDYKTWGVFYNTKIFDELGIEIPSTQSELIAVSKKIEAAGYDVWADWYKDGASVDIQTRIVVWTRAAQRGDYDLFEQLMSGNKKLADYPYVKEALDDWATRLQFNRNDALSNSQNQAIELFVSEQAAMFFMGSWSIGDIETAAKGNPNFSYDFFLCPISENPNDVIMNIQIDDAFMVNPKSPNADWSQKFMEYWMVEGGITWSEITNQPLTSGDTSPALSPVTQAIAAAKKTGNYVGYGEFSTAYTSEFTAAWRKGLTEWAENVIKGGSLNSTQAVANIQKLYDNIIATN